MRGYNIATLFTLTGVAVGGILLLMNNIEVVNAFLSGINAAHAGGVEPIDVFNSAIYYAANDTGMSVRRIEEILHSYFTVNGHPASWLDLVS